MEYSKITKPKFISEVKKALDFTIFDEEHYYLLEDLTKNVTFDVFYFNDLDDKSKEDFILGHKELLEGFHVFFCESIDELGYPVNFILYWDGKKIRGYTPMEGNTFNKKTNGAYWDDEEPYDSVNIKASYNYDLMVKDILENIKLKNEQ